MPSPTPGGGDGGKRDFLSRLIELRDRLESLREDQLSKDNHHEQLSLRHGKTDTVDASQENYESMILTHGVVGQPGVAGVR